MSKKENLGTGESIEKPDTTSQKDRGYEIQSQ